MESYLITSTLEHRLTSNHVVHYLSRGRIRLEVENVLYDVIAP